MPSLFKYLKEMLFKNPKRYNEESFFNEADEQNLKQLQAGGIKYKQTQAKNEKETNIKEREI